MKKSMTAQKTKEIFLVRHGTTDYNEEDRLQGRIDNPLNERGLAEAEQLAVSLADIPFKAVFSSPLDRARSTARILTEKRGLPAVVLPGLIEIDLGSWENRLYQQVIKEEPDFYRRWLADDTLPIPGGESFRQVYLRLQDPVAEIKNHQADCILVVGHASVNRAILAHLLGLVPATARFFRCGNCHYSRFIISNGLGGDYTVLSAWNISPQFKATP